jgi:hypothetical protein
MPGTLTIDAAKTFQAAVFMGSAPKNKFGTDQQDITATGERKWEVSVAVTYFAEHGMRPVNEVITLTVLGADPGASIQQGSAVEFDRLRVGFSTPELRGERVRGGKPWYQADGIRQSHHRAVKAAEAA